MNTLKNHFIEFYRVLSKQQPEKLSYGITRYILEIPIHYHNVLMGVPQNLPDTCIEEQLKFFRERQLPFAWYYDTEDPSFKQKLLDHRFHDIGVFQGMAGPLNHSMPLPELPADCTIEQVHDLTELNEVVSTVFEFTGKGKELFRKALEESPLQHWLFRKEGKAVAAVSTFRENGIVSFWNQATLAEARRHGYSTLLCKWALCKAKEAGCTTVASFIQSDGMAYGINTQLGLKTEWKFQVLFSPPTPFIY